MESSDRSNPQPSPENRRQAMVAWTELVSKIGQRYARAALSDWKFHGTPEEQERQRAALEELVELDKNIAESVKSGRGCVLFGPSGTGKDHVLSALMRSACMVGLKVDWINGADFFGDVRDRMDSQTRESQAVRALVFPDLLCISDPLPPAGTLTPFQMSQLFRVIDARYRRGRPTWISVNVASGEEASQRMGPATVDRLRDNSIALFFDWQSYRRLPKQQPGKINPASK